MQRREFLKFSSIAAASILLPSSRIFENKMIGQKGAQEKIIFSQFANFAPSQEILSKANPYFLIWINLPEFSLRLYENGKQIDQTMIAAGRLNSPQVETWRSLIEIRPSFTPTQNEKKKGYKSCGPDRTNPPFTPHNPMGRRKILIAGNKFKLHGTAVPSSIGDARSNGCTRVDNSGIERITDYMISKLPVKKHIGKSGGYEAYTFSMPFEIIQCYRLWDNLWVEGNILHLTAYPDIHKHLKGPRDYQDFPVVRSTPGNAYTFGHLASDLEKIGLRLKEGINENSTFFKKFFSELRGLLIGADEPQKLEVSLPKNIFEP